MGFLLASRFLRLKVFCKKKQLEITLIPSIYTTNTTTLLILLSIIYLYTLVIILENFVFFICENLFKHFEIVFMEISSFLSLRIFKKLVVILPA